MMGRFLTKELGGERIYLLRWRKWWVETTWWKDEFSFRYVEFQVLKSKQLEMSLVSKRSHKLKMLNKS